MKVRCFTIPVQDSQDAIEELNLFLGSHRVSTVDHQFVSDGQNSLWAVWVSFTESQVRGKGTSKRREGVDYREVLSPEEFAIYCRLRELRKELSERDDVPAYTVFTNEQLAEMVRQGVRSVAALGRISGVGQGRIEKYAKSFLDLLVDQGWGKNDGPDTIPLETPQ